MFTFKVDEEIELQLFQLNDCKRLYNLVNENRNHLRDWLPWVDDMSSHYQYETIIPMWLKQFADNNGFNTGILFQGELVGAIGLHYIDWRNRHTSIGYYLAKNAEGHGIMTRSVQALLNYAFNDLSLNRVEIRCGEGNLKSRAIPERLGFTMEGKIRDGELLYNKFHDLIVYGMLARNWQDLQ